MNEFNKVAVEMMDTLYNIIQENDNVKEYFTETYGALAEDNPDVCIIDYLINKYDVANYYSLLDR